MVFNSDGDRICLPNSQHAGCLGLCSEVGPLLLEMTQVKRFVPSCRNSKAKLLHVIDLQARLLLFIASLVVT